MPDILVTALRDYRREQLELRMQLGAGKLPDDALLFSQLDGSPLNPSNVSSNWGAFAGRIGMPEITFHGLRHTHASQLIASGVDIVTISKRLAMRSRELRLRSTPICLQATTARRPPQ
jgi:integrase